MPKQWLQAGGYAGPKPVLHLIAGTLVASALAWLAVQLAIIGFQPQFINGLNAQGNSISNTIYDYQWRLIGMGGALSASYYAARWPMSRSATFMAFVACFTIALSWIPVDLPGAYQTFDFNFSRCSSAGIDNKWCALQIGSQALATIQTALVTLLALWALVRHVIADTYPNLGVTEHTSHILVWLGVASYACWCGAATQLAIDPNYAVDTAEFINGWNAPALHIASIAGLSLAAFVSWGSTRGSRVNALLFVIIGLHILAPSIAYDARTLWEPQYGSTCSASFGNYLCMAKNAVVAGMGGVAGVFLVLALNYVALLMSPVPQDAYTTDAEPIGAKAAEPSYAQPSVGYSETTTAAYPGSYDVAPAYGTPSNRVGTSTTASPFPPV